MDVEKAGKNMKNMVIIFCFLLIILNICDGIATYVILENGGIELNPIANYLIETSGTIEGIVIIKSSTILLILFITFLNLIKPHRVSKSLVLSCFLVASVAYLLVVLYSGVLCFMIFF